MTVTRSCVWRAVWPAYADGLNSEMTGPGVSPWMDEKSARKWASYVERDGGSPTIEAQQEPRSVANAVERSGDAQ